MSILKKFGNKDVQKQIIEHFKKEYEINIDEFPEGFVLHFDNNSKGFQLVDAKVHRIFSHIE